MQKQLKPILATIVTLPIILIASFAITNAVIAQDLSLQEKVETAQANYDKLQIEALKGLKTYCKAWTDLSNSKAELAKKLNINSNVNVASPEVCDKLTIPSSF